MIIEKDKVVSLIYELRVDSLKGDIIESLNADKPLVFIYGNGSLLPKFEEFISGMKSGDAFNFGLKCEDAYGPATEEALVDIPKNVFEVDGEFDAEIVKEGNAIPMMDGDGNKLNGVVVEVGKDSVKMDFNHPLAGDDLYFSGKIVDIREATAEEMEHGHIHGAEACGDECGDGCNSGSCGCGCN